MRLGETLNLIEKEIGKFSKHYKTIDKEHTYDIPFNHKPAEQIIEALGGTIDSKSKLSTPTSIISKNNDVTINGFTKNTSGKKLILEGARLDRLLSSSKVYINSDLFPVGLYQRALKEQLINNEGLPPETKGIHWENLAVGICISQEIDLLVGTLKSKNDRAHTTYKEGRIGVDEPALLLLSSSRLNLNGELGSHLDETNQAHFIEGMFRNLFDATQKQGRSYIAMPAAGLGKHGGKPEMYFSCLMKVAREFPKLNIIYHPGDHEGIFDKELKKSNLQNVARATKNVIFIADLLTKRGNLCALHIPADSDVIYGLSDIGGHWKSIESVPFHFGSNPFANKKNETSQTFIGGFSTAPLNSYGLNPKTYEFVIERSLSPRDVNPNHSIRTTVKDQKLNFFHNLSTNNTVQTKPSADKNSIPVLLDKTQKKSEDRVLTSTNQSPIPAPIGSIRIEKHVEKPQENAKNVDHIIVDLQSDHDSKDKRLDAGNGSLVTSGIFKSQPEFPITKTEQITSLSNKQIREINQAIDRLAGEIQSCWPYPNKEVKQIKIDALEALKTKARTMSIQEAVAVVKNDYPRALEGSLSTRTRDLFDKFERSVKPAIKMG